MASSSLSVDSVEIVSLPIGRPVISAGNVVCICYFGCIASCHSICAAKFSSPKVLPSKNQSRTMRLVEMSSVIPDRALFAHQFRHQTGPHHAQLACRGAACLRYKPVGRQPLFHDGAIDVVVVAPLLVFPGVVRRINEYQIRALRHNVAKDFLCRLRTMNHQIAIRSAGPMPLLHRSAAGGRAP